jgi:hypothetical protein
MAPAFLQSGSKAGAAAVAIALGICAPNCNLAERDSSRLNGAGTLAGSRAYKFVIARQTILRAMGE